MADIGVRYCGGCNPRYDRTAAVEMLQMLFPQHRFLSAAVEGQYALLLMVCGCITACMPTDDAVQAPLFTMRGQADIEKAVLAIQALEKSKEKRVWIGDPSIKND